MTVSDTGPGIPEAERQNVFRRFYRLEASRTTPGDGLGLALVKAIAELHCATVELSHNRPGLRVAVRFRSRDNAQPPRPADHEATSELLRYPH